MYWNIIIFILFFQSTSVTSHESAEVLNGIDDIIAKIKEFIEQIKKKIQDWLNHIMNETEIGKIIQKIVDAIKNMVGQAGEKVNECINKEMPKIMEIAQESQEKTMKCMEGLKETAEAIIAESGSYLLEAIKNFISCVSNGGNPQECIQKIFQQVVGEIQEKVSAAMEESAMCVQKVQDETQEKMTEIYQNVLTCVTTKNRFAVPYPLIHWNIASNFK